MAAKIKLESSVRKVLGRKVKSLRREGVLPANIFGKNIKSIAIQVDLGEFQKVFGLAGETALVEINLNGKVHPVLISEVQVDPVSNLPVHADFKEVDLKEKVTADVPVELIGESPVEKSGAGTLVQQVEEIQVEALPMDLPEKFELDASVLTKVDDSFSIADIKVGDKVTILDNKDKIIAKVEALREEEEEPEPVAEVVEGEAEEPAEGEEAKETTGDEAKEEPSKEEEKKE